MRQAEEQNAGENLPGTHRSDRHEALLEGKHRNLSSR